MSDGQHREPYQFAVGDADLLDEKAINGLLEALPPIVANTLARHLMAQDRRIARYERAIRWACGEVGSFPVRPEGKGAYYWRTELRERSGLAYIPPKETT